MQVRTFQVPNIGCDGCVKSIKNELSELTGVVTVNGDTATRMVTVEWDTPATWEKIVETLTEIDYAPAQA